MPDQPHTPTTEQVRMDYIQASEGDRVNPEESGPQFDRWLATVETAAEQRGKEQGWDEGTQEYMNSIWGDGPEEPVNPYRADQMEGDE